MPILDKLQRPLLIVGIALSGYFLLLQWQADYGVQESSGVLEDTLGGEEVIQSGEESSAGKSRSSNTELIEAPTDELIESENLVDSEKSRGAPSRENYIIIENDKLRLIVNRRGGDIVGAALKDYKEQLNGPQPLLLLREDNERLSIAQSGLVGADGFDAQIKDRPLYDTFDGANSYSMRPGQDSMEVPLIFTKDGVEVVKTFRLFRDRHDIEVAFDIANDGNSPWSASMFVQFKRDKERPTYEKAAFGTRSFTGAAFSGENDSYQKLSFKDMAKRNFKDTTKGGWSAMVQHYFVAAWIPLKSGSQYFQNARETSSGDYIFGFSSPVFTVAPQSTYENGVRLYLGPKSQDPLAGLAPNLELTIDYGWLWYISQPLFKSLDFIHSYVGNWGLAIMIMTLIIKLLFFPLTNSSYKSMARMKKLQPQMEQLRQNYGDNRQLMQKEVMELYKREKVNPLGGCLPILIQMPIFISFYWALIESVELRHAPLIGWIQDLSAQDPFFVLPLLMGLSMFVQQLFSPKPADPTQAKIVKLLPVIFTVFFLWFPAGLVLYWVVNNVLSIAQQYVINRRLGTLVTPNINLGFLKIGGNKAKPTDVDKTKPQGRVIETTGKSKNDAAKNDVKSEDKQADTTTQEYNLKPYKPKKHRK